MRTETDVLVVGAGPVGLTAAIQTAMMGARVQIVEREAGPRPWAPALAVHPRTMEVLRGLGVTDQLMARGLDEVGLQIHVRGFTVRGSLGSLDLASTRFPFILFIPQPELETILRDRLSTLGVDVRWGTTLTSVRPTPNGVECRTVSGGRECNSHARYVVGCDGADSTVRRCIGIDFRGRDYRESIVVADVGVEGDLDMETAHAFLGGRGILFLFPLSSGRWRLIAPAHREGEPTDPGLLVTRHGVSVSLADVRWQRVIRPQHRLATSYGIGRVFLAGDAAHVHSPAGAQGMNTGIQDAVNLGWKLALVAQGAPEALLDSYEEERRPVAKMVVRLTGLAYAIEVSGSPPLRWGRRVLGLPMALIALNSPKVLALVSRMVSGLDTWYRAGAIGEDRGGGPFAPGRRLPDLSVGKQRLHELISGFGFHLLMRSPGTALDETHPAVESGWLQIDVLGELVGGLPTPILVRPDGYIAACGDIASINEYLARWLGTQLPAARSTL